MATTEILKPVGFTIVDTLQIDTVRDPTGAPHFAHTANTTLVSGAALVAVNTAALALPGTSMTAAAASAANLAVAASANAQQVTASGTSTASQALATNFINAINATTDTLAVAANKVVLQADVQIMGSVDEVALDALKIVDTTLELGALDPGAIGNDLTSDGSAILIPGAPANLPAGKNAALYSSAVSWNVRGGDFNSDGTPVAPHLKPMWDFRGSLALASPDASARDASFVFVPEFTADAVTLTLYYAVGNVFAPMQVFTATPFSA